LLLFFKKEVLFFFFEKKNQKTFIFYGLRLLRGASQLQTLKIFA